LSIFKGIKRTPADAAFSDYVREKARWKCEWPGCYKQFDWTSSERAGLHCSHFISRANKRVRYDLMNAAALCAFHHDYAGKNPDIHAEFFLKRIGDVEMKTLRVIAETTSKYKIDEKLNYMIWKKALQDLRDERDNVVGKRA